MFALGDFYYDMSQNSSNKMTELIQAYDLKQLIQETNTLHRKFIVYYRFDFSSKHF